MMSNKTLIYIAGPTGIGKTKLSIYLAKKFGTPIYCYSYKKIKENILNFKKNFNSFKPLICFSVKSNSNLYFFHIADHDLITLTIYARPDIREKLDYLYNNYRKLLELVLLYSQVSLLYNVH